MKTSPRTYLLKDGTALTVLPYRGEGTVWSVHFIRLGDPCFQGHVYGKTRREVFSKTRRELAEKRDPTIYKIRKKLEMYGKSPADILSEEILKTAVLMNDKFVASALNELIKSLK